MEQVLDDSCELQQTAEPSSSTDSSPTRPGSIIINLKLSYVLILKNLIYNVIEISMLGRCVGCFKAKRSTKYCRQIKGHKGDKAAPCPSCFEQGISV